MADSRHIRFLASVRDENEARLALAGGADIIDCKEPLAGALGALPLDVVRRVRSAIPASVPVSATVGDLPCEGPVLCSAAQEMAATGVDYVKVGIFPDGDARSAIAALGTLELGTARLVAVLFADAEPDLTLIKPLREAGFAGVLIDTAHKARGSLVDHVPLSQLGEFVKAARGSGLFAGLAGSLRAKDIGPLSTLEPDIIGFRGALCAGSQRMGTLDVTAVRAISHALSRVQSAQEALAS